MSIITAEFWENQWQELIDHSPVRRRVSGSDAVKLERWNAMAPDFARHTSEVKSEAEREDMIQKMVAQGILQSKSTVLDIGAGPGSWALPLAQNSAHVTALEPADGMTNILQSRIMENKIENITIDRRTWQSVDLDATGWHKAFDLVFASMTPGIDGPQGVKKMIMASRGYCYLSAFSGPGWQKQYADLWQTFFNEPMGEQTHDIIYPFNLVYAMGFRPTLEFSWKNRKRDRDRDQAIEHFILFFQTHMKITRKVEDTIMEYIDSRCINGRYAPVERVCRGTMIWRVQGEDAVFA